MDRWNPRTIGSPAETKHPGVFRADLRKPRQSPGSSPRSASLASTPAGTPPMPEFYEFKPAPREACALSDSTMSPVCSARSAEVFSDSQSTPQMGTRQPGDDFDDLPRSNSTSSLGDLCDAMTPRSDEGNAGRLQMPMSFPAPDASDPWASERLHFQTRIVLPVALPAFQATLGMPSITQSPATFVVTESSDLCQSTSEACIQSSPDSVQTDPCSADSEEEGEEALARVYMNNARDMSLALTEELRSIDDEMQEVMADLLNLKKHVAAARSQITDSE